jgi:hypothetical protein
MRSFTLKRLNKEKMKQSKLVEYLGVSVPLFSLTFEEMLLSNPWENSKVQNLLKNILQF